MRTEDITAFVKKQPFEPLRVTLIGGQTGAVSSTRSSRLFSTFCSRKQPVGSERGS
jgi:hypothetical protein